MIGAPTPLTYWKTICCCLQLLVGTAFFSACQTPASTEDAEPSTAVTYANEHGRVIIEPTSDSTARVRTINNDGIQWDTTMRVTIYDTLQQVQGVATYDLGDGWRGIRLDLNHRLSFYEYSGFALMGTRTKIPQLYEQFFYMLDQPTTIEGVLRRSKAGLTLNGIYLLDLIDEAPTEKYVKVTGTLIRAPYPEGYYSTAASPQGMFSDAGPHYRLVIQQPSIIILPPKTYKGTLINVNGRAAFAWEMAFSEPFFFEGKDMPWPPEELSKSVAVQGHLIRTAAERSIFVNWELVEAEYSQRQ